MYRNTYLQMYKNAAINDCSLTILFTHFTQIYNTLGCVLQDLELQIGKAISQQVPAPLTDKPRQSIQSYHKSKDKGKEKQIIKIEESQSENVDKNVILQKQAEVAQLPPQSKKIEAKKKEEDGSESSDCNWMMSRILEDKPRRPWKSSEPYVQEPPVEKARSYFPSPVGSDNFEALFENRKSLKMEIDERPARKAPLADIPQQPQQISISHIENTYQDFLDRFFQENQSRKSR